jgi:two-component system OmpR family sensor kinase
MLDNAIKYSKDSKVIIEVKNSEIIFKNCSDKIDIDTFLQPFSKGENSKSLGLGLYIVSSILNAHMLNLDYKYENGFNNFIFKNTDSNIKS